MTIMPFYRCIWAWGILLALLAYGVHSLEEADGLEEIQRAIDSIHSQSKTISSLVNSLGNQDLNANQDKLR